jgi:hypothetical protein
MKKQRTAARIARWTDLTDLHTKNVPPGPRVFSQLRDAADLRAALQYPPV